MTLAFTNEIFYWKGPAPHYFVWVPEEDSRQIKALEKLVTYGWGMIPAVVRIGQTEYKTALWPKDGAYVVPIKQSIRKAERLQEGDAVFVQLDIA